MTFAGTFPDLTGEPWEPHHDAKLREDHGWGCAVWIIAKRSRRSHDEVLQRLADLGLQLEGRPVRKIRCTTWTRR
jgi:hypothetical protein